MIETKLRTEITRLEGELDPHTINGLTGMMRVANLGKGLLTKPDLDEYFTNYQEAARLGRASIYIAGVFFSWDDEPETGGFSRTTYNETEGGVHIENLYVTSAARRANIGSLLLGKVVEDAQKEGAAYVQYDGMPDEDFLRAHNFTDHPASQKMRLNLQGTGVVL
jgi:ribosomal protein S18 acetylase RimI-like enzyme